MTRTEAIEHIRTIEAEAKRAAAELPKGEHERDPRTIAKLAAHKVASKIGYQAMRLETGETDDIESCCLAAEAIADKAELDI